MKTKGMKFKEEEVKEIIALAQELENEANDNLPLKDNLYMSLTARLDDIDVSKIVQEIWEGAETFQHWMQEGEETDTKDAIEKILEQSPVNEKSIEEQYEIFSGVLAAGMDVIAKNPEYGLKPVTDVKIKKEGGITEADLKILKEAVIEYLDQFSVLSLENPFTEAVFDLIGKNAGEELEKVFEDENKKYYVSTAVYILQRQGKLSSISQEMGAREISIGITAAFEAAKVKVKGILGKIPWQKVKEKLKKICSTALTLLVGISIAVVAVAVFGVIFRVMSDILTFGIFGIIVTIIVAMFGGYKVIEALTYMANYVKDVISNTLEEISECTAKMREWIHETLLPKLRKFWENIRKKLAYLLMGKQTEADQQEETSEEETKKDPEKTEEDDDTEEDNENNEDNGEVFA